VARLAWDDPQLRVQQPLVMPFPRAEILIRRHETGFEKPLFSTAFCRCAGGCWICMSSALVGYIDDRNT
jgi:hypothetical protein